MRILTPGIMVLAWLSILTPGAAARTDASVENLRGFAVLYGYVRYFHPSDEAAAVDWNAFAIRGAERVHGAADPGELRGASKNCSFQSDRRCASVGSARRHHRFRRSYAPDTQSLEVVAWQHQGGGCGRANSLYWNARTNGVNCHKSTTYRVNSDSKGGTFWTRGLVLLTRENAT